MKVISLSISPTHTFSKVIKDEIELVAGEGVVGDAHRGVKVKHRSRVAQNPDQPNLRQIHLVQRELFDELREKGFEVRPGDIGENVLTEGINLLGLPTGAHLLIGSHAKIEITGLRNPCKQLDHFQDGLMAATLDRDDAGNLIRKAGVMGIVLEGGTIRRGDSIEVALLPLPHKPLERV
ncbi:MAG: MOSC domain-containing protein [Chloroflexota bacterium]